MSFLQALEDRGFTEIRLVPWRHTWGAVAEDGFTWNIFEGRLTDDVALDHWCYSSREAAAASLKGWSDGDEPTGWFWHPKTRRRRPGGHVAEEFVADGSAQ